MALFIWTILFRGPAPVWPVADGRWAGRQWQTQEGQPNGCGRRRQRARRLSVRQGEYPSAAADESGLLPVFHPALVADYLIFLNLLINIY